MYHLPSSEHGSQSSDVMESRQEVSVSVVATAASVKYKQEMY